MTMAKKISVRQVTKNGSYRCITKRCHVFHRPRPVRIERNWPSVLSNARGLLKTSCTVKVDFHCRVIFTCVRT